MSGVSDAAVEAAAGAIREYNGREDVTATAIARAALTAALPLLGQDADDPVWLRGYNCGEADTYAEHRTALTAADDRATRAETERDELRARMEVLADEFHTLAESWYEADRSRGAVAIAYSNGRGESYTMAEDLLRNLLASTQAEPEVDRG